MVKALFDTNILIDFLRGIPEARTELARYEERAISIVTWMEIMEGAPPGAESTTRDFLGAFELVELDAAVAARAVVVRRERRLKLPDAIIWASAKARCMLLVTRDAKAFPRDDPGIRVPYQI
jgi:predicted nucleic acid-binding protein